MAFSCFSQKNTTEEDKKQKQASILIENEIKKENKEQGYSFKLLLLGTGDAGKSTFTKQMAFIYGSATPQFLGTFTGILRENCLDGMQVLLTGMQESSGGIPESIQAVATKVLNASELDPAVAADVQTLYASKLVLEAAEKAANLNIQGGVGGAKYYFSNASRFASHDYIPTKEDVLMARRKTVGIVETHFEFNNASFTLVDVGGQRSERKKMAPLFQFCHGRYFSHSN